MPEADQKPSPAEAKRNVAYLLVFFFVAGAIILLLRAGAEKERAIAIALTEGVTNSSGVVEAVFEVRNEAADCSLEPRVMVALDEEHGIASGEELRQLLASGRSFITTYMDGSVQKYIAVKNFSAVDTKVWSSVGRNLKQGGVAVLRFAKPIDRPWRLTVDCWSSTIPPKSGLRRRFEELNAWGAGTTAQARGLGCAVPGGGNPYDKGSD